MPFALRKEPDDRAVAMGALPITRGALHEFYAGAQADGAGLSALVMMLEVTGQKTTKLWVRHEAQDREMGAPHPPGLRELGFDPASMLLVRVRDAQSALQAGLEGARYAALGAVIVELWGEAKAYDLTASRRLSLAAKTSRVPVFLLRIAANPTASAAETRWLVRAAPSRPLAAHAPGHPAFHLTLLRARNGQEGRHYHLEWMRDAQCLESGLSGRGDPGYAVQPDDGRCAPLPRRLVPVPFDRPGPAHDEAPRRRQAG
jgi:protein ImuA